MKAKSSKDRRARERERAKERVLKKENDLQSRGISTNTTTATESPAAAQAPAPETTEAASAETATAQPTEAAAAAPAPPAEPVEGSRRRSSAQKRKAAANSSSGGSISPFSPPSKRAAKEKSQPSLPSLHNGPLTRARQSPNKAAAAAADALSNPQNPSDQVPAPSPVPLPAGEAIDPPVEPISPIKEPVAPDAAIQAEFEAIRSRDPNAHVVPAPAGWFSWTKIHKLEERALASFFDGKSEERSPEIYMELRNAIMKRFHLEPQTKMELKDLSELSVGNSDARQEVMEFLENWGLINFHPFPPPDSVEEAADRDGGARTTSLIDKLFSFEMAQPQPQENVGPRVDSSTPAVLPRLLSESAIVDEAVRPEGPSVDYHCNSCSADCSRKRFHCQTQADFDLCSECYNDGKFDSGMQPTDFILMESAEVPGASGGNWTDQETLLLLEALELYRENWNEIAEHVATKTKEQCILHFVQMPIEDSFLEGDKDDDANIVGNASLANRSSSILNVDESKEKKSEEGEERPVSSPGEKNSLNLAVTEVTETKSAAKEDQPMSSLDDLREPEDTGKVVEVAEEKSANLAVRALKDAFQAIGSLPSTGGLLSFAEAGSPVMALAAFLVGLVDANIAGASARSSLKAMSEDSPEIQLAARHCFLLEDPPGHSKTPPAEESSVVNMANGEPQKEDKQGPVSEGSGALKDCADKNAENLVPAGKKSMVPSQEQTETSHVAGSDDLVSAEKSVPRTLKVSGKSTSLAQDAQTTVKGSSDKALVMEALPCTVKGSGELASQAEDRQCTELIKGKGMASDPSEVKEPQQGGSNRAAESREKRGDGDTKAVHGKNEKNQNLTESDDDHNIDRIKHAALTALSAAAVKAKLLAKQEENEIRELVSVLIEKQLCKLDTKLSLFTEMENVIMRVREQLDQTRQKLYHERTQIIAARFAAHGPGRPIAPSLPLNRAPMNSVNMGPRPPIVSPQRPPITQAMRTSIPPSKLPFPGAIAGSSAHALGQDTHPSPGTNFRS